METLGVPGRLADRPALVLHTPETEAASRGLTPLPGEGSRGQGPSPPSPAERSPRLGPASHHPRAPGRGRAGQGRATHHQAQAGLPALRALHHLHLEDPVGAEVRHDGDALRQGQLVHRPDGALEDKARGTRGQGSEDWPRGSPLHAAARHKGGGWGRPLTGTDPHEDTGTPEEPWAGPGQTSSEQSCGAETGRREGPSSPEAG